MLGGVVAEMAAKPASSGVPDAHRAMARLEPIPIRPP